MLSNYVTIALSSLSRNRTLSTMNILGLAVGLTCGLLIFLLVGFLLSFDTYHPNAERSQLSTRQIGGWPVRRGLVVLQFFITQLFVLSVLVIMLQLRYMQQKDLGFRKEAILTISVPATNPLEQQLLRNRLQQVPGVEQVALGNQMPAAFAGSLNADAFTYDLRIEPEKFDLRVRTGDVDYLSLFGIDLVAGRNSNKLR